MKRFTLNVFLTLFAVNAYSGDLTAPFDIQDTNLLPTNVRSLKFKTVFFNFENEFGGSGNVKPLAAPFNTDLTWGQVLDSIEEEKGLVKRLSAESLMPNTNASIGQTSGDLSIHTNVMVPILAYGLTEKLTLAVAVPVYQVDMSVDTGFIANPTGQFIVDQTSETSPLSAQDLAAGVNNAIQKKALKLGYKRIQSERFSSVGDIKLISKYQAFKNKRTSVVVQPSVTLPTGAVEDPDKVIGVPTGDGQVDVASEFIVDHYIDNFRLNAHFSYIIQFADQFDTRIPDLATPTSSLSSFKETVSRNLGDQLATGVSFNYGKLTRGFNFGIGYSYQYMGATRYQGKQYSQAQYNLLEADHENQFVHTTIMKMGFSTIDWFKEKKFVYPFQAFLVYSHPFSGSNVLSDDVIGAELVMFF